MCYYITNRNWKTVIERSHGSGAESFSMDASVLWMSFLSLYGEDPKKHCTCGGLRSCGDEATKQTVRTEKGIEVTWLRPKQRPAGVQCCNAMLRVLRADEGRLVSRGTGGAGFGGSLFAPSRRAGDTRDAGTTLRDGLLPFKFSGLFEGRQFYKPFLVVDTNSSALLEAFAANASSKYTALHYTWGGEHLPQAGLVIDEDGKDETGEVSVSPETTQAWLEVLSELCFAPALMDCLNTNRQSGHEVTNLCGKIVSEESNRPLSRDPVSLDQGAAATRGKKRQKVCGQKVSGHHFFKIQSRNKLYAESGSVEFALRSSRETKTLFGALLGKMRGVVESLDADSPLLWRAKNAGVNFDTHMYDEITSIRATPVRATADAAEKPLRPVGAESHSPLEKHPAHTTPDARVVVMGLDDGSSPRGYAQRASGGNSGGNRVASTKMGKLAVAVLVALLGETEESAARYLRASSRSRRYDVWMADSGRFCTVRTSALPVRCADCQLTNLPAHRNVDYVIRLFRQPDGTSYSWEVACWHPRCLASQSRSAESRKSMPADKWAELSACVPCGTVDGSTRAVRVHHTTN
ncbi:MAG: hypothetical protein CMI16_07170 [Opitutaceae bacterium]|nr:hypothetical protein [Opitutaceae bacterium]